MPHKSATATITYRTTRYEYDEVGNQTRVISPRGVDTTDDPNDFATVTVYDALNRVKEQQEPYDADDERYKTADKTIYDVRRGRQHQDGQRAAVGGRVQAGRHHVHVLGQRLEPHQHRRVEHQDRRTTTTTSATRPPAR